MDLLVLLDLGLSNSLINIASNQIYDIDPIFRTNMTILKNLFIKKNKLLKFKQ